MLLVDHVNQGHNSITTNSAGGCRDRRHVDRRGGWDSSPADSIDQTSKSGAVVLTIGPHRRLLRMEKDKWIQKDTCTFTPHWQRIPATGGTEIISHSILRTSIDVGVL